MTMVVILPGGYHPFHAGHMSLYNAATRAFPGAEIYVAASGDTKTRPFPFTVKRNLATLSGVDPSRFIQVKSPFSPSEITNNFDPNKDIVVFVRSEKDKNESPLPGQPRKDGTPSYYQAYSANANQPFGKHAYMAYLPTVEFANGFQSASEIRETWPKLSAEQKMKMIVSLYPRIQNNSKLINNVVGTFDQVLGTSLKESTMNDIQSLVSKIKPLLSEATFEQKAKFVDLLNEARKLLPQNVTESVGKLPPRYNPDGTTFRGSKNKMPTLEPDPAQDAEPLSAVDGSYDLDDLEQSIDSSQLLKLITSKMINLSPREEYIIRARFGLGGEEEQTLEQIGKVIGLSQERVRHLEGRAIRKLKKYTKPGWSPALTKVVNSDIVAEIEELKQRWQQIKSEESELDNSLSNPIDVFKDAASYSAYLNRNSKQRTLKQEKRKINAKIKELESKVFSLKKAKTSAEVNEDYLPEY